MSKVYSFEYVKARIESYGYIMVSIADDYKDGSSNLIVKDMDGYFYNFSHNKFSISVKTRKYLTFNSHNEYAVQNAQLWLNANGRDWNVISRSYESGRTEYFTFHCNVCNHDFEIRFHSVRNMGCKCPYCQRKRVSSINSFGDIFPDSAKYFDNKKNYPNTAYSVAQSSGIKYWWKCDVCEYAWYQSPIVMMRHSDVYACQRCSGTVVSDKNRFLLLYPEIAKEWDYSVNVGIDIYDMKHTSAKKVGWVCGKCNYSYVASVGDRVRNRHGCAACSGQVLTDRNRLSILYPEIALEWDYEKNVKKPEDFSFGSHTKTWWICPICQSSYDCQISNRVHNRGCPICCLSGKAQKIFKLLKNETIDFKPEYWFEDLRSDLGRVLRYDFGIYDKNKNIIALIEYDDAQHTRFIPSWHGTIDNFYLLQDVDLRKNEYAKNRNIPLLRIDYKNDNIAKTVMVFLKENLII